MSDERKSLIMGFCGLLMIAIVLSVRNLYSFSWSDESFYMAGVHRLYLGGKPFVDEWHPTQFYTVLLLPFYSMYVKLSGGGYDGIYLWARYFYLFLAFSAAYYVFYVFSIKIKLKMRYCLLAGSLVMLYSRANIMGVSYYNVFFLSILTASMILIVVLLGSEEMSRTKCSVYGAMVGIFTGLGIVTIPTVMAPIGISFMVFLLYALFRREHSKRNLIVTGILAGLTLDAVTYLIFVFSRVSFWELMIHIGYVFHDKGHEMKSILEYLSFVGALVFGYGKYLIVFLIAAVCIRIIPCARKLRNALYFASVPVLMYSVYAYATSHMGSYIVFGLYGVFLLVLFIEKDWLRDRELEIEFCVLGISAGIMIVAFMLASSTNDPMSAGFVCLSFITLIVLNRKTLELKEKYGQMVCAVDIMILSCMLVMTGWVKVSSVYRDAPLSQMDTVLERGPAKGLITTAEHADQYNACMDAIDYINEIESGTDEKVSIIVSKLAPWMYVGMNIQNGAPVAWRVEINDERLEEYYDSHDINYLKYVLVLKEEYGGYIGAGNPEGTFLTPNENEISGWLGNILKKEYDIVNMRCGTLYVRNENDR